MNKITLILVFLVSCSNNFNSDPKDISSFIDQTVSSCQRETRNEYWGDCFTQNAVNNIYFISLYGEADVETLAKINSIIVEAIYSGLDYEIANEIFMSIVEDYKFLLAAIGLNDTSEIAFIHNQIKLKLISAIQSLKNIETI